MSFVFPNGSFIEAGQRIFLAFNSNALKHFYGVNATGQYVRNLSNKKQRLELRDPWGNLVDQVSYMDADPWPTEADGEGPYLMLKDLDLDNSLASSWTLSTDPLVFTGQPGDQQLTIFPNPFSSSLNIRNDTGKSLRMEIFNLLGQKVFEADDIDETSAGFSFDFMEKGVYVSRFYHGEMEFFVGKIVKN